MSFLNLILGFFGLSTFGTVATTTFFDALTTVFNGILSLFGVAPTS